MEGCEKELFKQRATLLSSCRRKKKKSLIDIYRLLQAIYGDKCVDVSTVVRCARRFEQEEAGYANFMVTPCISSILNTLTLRLPD